MIFNNLTQAKRVALRHGLSVALLWASSGGALAQAELAPELAQALKDACYRCHNIEKEKGDLRLDHAPPQEWSLDLWHNIRDMIDLDEMPPKKKDRFDETTKKMVLEHIDHFMAERSTLSPKWGYQRLSRHELINSLRQLSQCRLIRLDELREDQKVHNFESSSAWLKLSPDFMEQWYTLASYVSEQWIENPLERTDVKLRIAPSQMEAHPKSGREFGSIGWFFWSNAKLSKTIDVQQTGTYRIKVKAWSTPANHVDGAFVLQSDLEKSEAVFVPGREQQPSEHQILLKLPQGESEFSIGFMNDAYFPNSKDKHQRDRNLCILNLEIEGPLDFKSWNFSNTHQGFFGDVFKPADIHWNDAQRQKAIDAVCQRWLPKLFRREVSTAELEQWQAMWWSAYHQSQQHEMAYRQWLTSVLMSPSFLLRHHFLSPLDPQQWPSIFGERISMSLLGTASATTLFSQLEQLDRHLLNSLKQKESTHLLKRFFGQWWVFNELLHRQIDRKAFPNATESMLQAMHQQSLELCREALLKDTPLWACLSTMPLPKPKLWRLNEWMKSDRHSGAIDRKGFLSSFSFLTLSSYPHRNSLVLRGKYVLETLFGEKVPPAPPTAPSFDEKKLSNSPLSVADQLEQHLENDDCRSCHMRMDPIGLIFEPFDAMGRQTQTLGEDKRKLEEWMSALKHRKEELNHQYMIKFWIYLTGEDPSFDVREQIQEAAAEPQIGMRSMMLRVMQLVASSMESLSQSQPSQTTF